MSGVTETFDWSTPLIADACVALGLPVRIAPSGVRPLRAGTKACGPARPARHAGSVDVFLEAITEASVGDVLVIDNGGRLDEGCIGDLVAGEASASGLAAIVVWGAHRDTQPVLALGIPVWSHGPWPAGPAELRQRTGHELQAASLGHVTVTTTDYVFADDDGVIVVEQQELPRIMAAATDIAKRENAHALRLEAGELLRTQFQLDAFMQRRRDDPTFTFRAHLKSLGGAIEI